MKIDLNYKYRSAGITLLELLVAVAIVGVLGSIAYPSYLDYVTRTHRSTAKSMLLQVADRQEQFFGDNKQYAADLTLLGYGENGFMIDKQGAQVPAGDALRTYAVFLTDVTATTFTVNAAPEMHQAARDLDCQTLALTHAGQRGQTGIGPNCW